MSENTIRLNKYISESGLCSRREADRFIEQGQVTINGRRAAIGAQVKIGDVVKVNGNELEARKGEESIFIALNKPPGITSTTDDGIRDNIIQFVNHSQRIFPVGRLDKDSQGLIFLTNNGDMVNKILRAGNKHEKEYLVTVNKPLTDSAIKGMAAGVPMLGVVTRKCKIIQESVNTFRITLIQGLNRQIRRMAEHFGYEVIKLDRVRIMHISLKGLPVGDWRDLTDNEVKILYSMVENSSSDTIKKTKSGTIKKTKSGSAAKTATKKSAVPSQKRSSARKSATSEYTDKKTGKSGPSKKNTSSRSTRPPGRKSKR